MKTNELIVDIRLNSYFTRQTQRLSNKQTTNNHNKAVDSNFVLRRNKCQIISFKYLNTRLLAKAITFRIQVSIVIAKKNI